MPYSAPPGPRIAYDIDGTTVVMSRNNNSYTVSELPAASVQALNSERGRIVTVLRSSYTSSADADWVGALNGVQSWFGFLFPVAMDLDGVFATITRYASYRALASLPFSVSVSRDTTNCIDGTWEYVGHNLWCVFDPALSTFREDSAQYAGVFAALGALSGTSRGNPNALKVDDFHRRVFAEEGVGIRNVASSTSRGVKAVRVHVIDSSVTYDTLVNIQLFGSPQSVGPSARVDFWSVATDTALTADAFDWGNVPVGSSSTKTFRIKNLSGDKTAVNTRVRAVKGLSDTTPESSSLLLFSLDGLTWASFVNIASLSPGAVSEIIYMRHTTPLSYPLGTFAPRVTADVGSWI